MIQQRLICEICFLGFATDRLIITATRKKAWLVGHDSFEVLFPYTVPQHEFETFIGDVRHCLEAGCLYAAVIVTLTFPDICASLARPHGSREKGKIKARYIRWYNENALTRSYFEHLDGERCWDLRNGMVHNRKRTEIAGEAYDRVLFLHPQAAGSFPRIESGALKFRADEFAAHMARAALDWFLYNRETEPVRSRRADLMNFHVNGYPPYELIG